MSSGGKIGILYSREQREYIGDGIMDIQIGDIVKLKKQHPCGSYEWEVLRIGIDFRLKCTGCGHMVMLPRKQVERSIKQIRKPE